MLKPHAQIWTHLSRLHKDVPAWISANFSAEPSRALPGTAAAQESAPAPLATALPATPLRSPETGTGSQEGQTEAGSFTDQLLIPILSECPGSKTRQALQDKGQFLARQERWDELSNLIRSSDQARRSTSCGLPEADLLAYGARSDVVNAVEHALQDRTAKPGGGQTSLGKKDSNRRKNSENPILIEGVMALESLRRDHPKDSYLTAIVALAHIDIAWTWRAAASQDYTAQANREAQLRRCTAHFDRAAVLLAPLEDQSQSSAFLLAARCALFAGRSADTLDVADAYAALIDQTPSNPRPMRALGVQMLPRANGSYAALELEARRTAARTQEQWGAGGYTWVYFDAMALDEQACARVDPKFFLDGLQDILCADPSQEMINLLAAYCAVSLPKGEGISASADRHRLEISKAARWLVRSHLRELHPLIWAHASEGFDNNARITSLRRFAAHGQAKALHCIAGIYRDELDSGHRITFSPQGVNLTPA